MIVMRHKKTGELHIVETAEGYGKGWIDEGPVPEGVNPHWLVYDKKAGAIVADLVPLRDAKWAEIKEKREFAKFGICETPFGPMQVDLVSRQLFSQAAAIANALGEERLWTMADNTEVVLKPEDFNTILAAVERHTEGCHVQGTELRSAIAQAGTIPEIDDIRWPDAPKETQA